MDMSSTVQHSQIHFTIHQDQRLSDLASYRMPGKSKPNSKIGVMLLARDLTSLCEEPPNLILASLLSLSSHLWISPLGKKRKHGPETSTQSSIGDMQYHGGSFRSE